MENIPSLNKFTLVFQIFGLQYFSLKELNGKPATKYPNGFFQVQAVLWIILSFTFFAFTFEDYRATPTDPDANFLNIIIKFLNSTNYSTSISICVIFTFLTHSKLTKFFNIADEISSSFFAEFDFKVNFKQIKLISSLSYLVTLPYVITLSQYLQFFQGVNFYDQFIRPTMWFLIGIHIIIYVLRFNFYVQILNLLLTCLKSLIRENFSRKIFFNSKIKKKSFEVWKICPNDFTENKKIVTMRKIYLLIKEMADIINDTMGFIVFMHLFIIITNVIRFGHEFLSDIYGSVETLSKVFCEFTVNIMSVIARKY